MRALLEGNRTAPLGVVAGLAGVICLLIASVGLNVKHANDLNRLRETIIHRCEQRAAYDRSNHDSVEADAELYQQLLDIADRAPANPNPTIRTLVAEQRRVIAQARDRKLAAARAGVIGSCDQYR